MSEDGIAVKRPRRDPNMADEDKHSQLMPEGSRDHGVKMLSGLNHLRSEKILCDVTLIAEGETTIQILLPFVRDLLCLI